MAKTHKIKKPLKVWYCIQCGCYCEPESKNKFHSDLGHPGRFGTPTTKFYDEHTLTEYSDGEKRWVLKNFGAITPTHYSGRSDWSEGWGL